jgi:Mn2+/Fe2+ NRAMP family transporter
LFSRPWTVFLLSGASNNDPTTVASLAVIGSTTGYALGWLVLLIVPMLSVVQAVSAQTGMVAKTGLEAAVRGHYGRGRAWLALLSVLFINLVTLAADLEGGGAGSHTIDELSDGDESLCRREAASGATVKR